MEGGVGGFSLKLFPDRSLETFCPPPFVDFLGVTSRLEAEVIIRSSSLSISSLDTLTRPGVITISFNDLTSRSAKGGPGIPKFWVSENNCGLDKYTIKVCRQISVVLDNFLGPAHLARCPCFSVVPEAEYLRGKNVGA